VLASSFGGRGGRRDRGRATGLAHLNHLAAGEGKLDRGSFRTLTRNKAGPGALLAQRPCLFESSGKGGGKGGRTVRASPLRGEELDAALEFGLRNFPRDEKIREGTVPAGSRAKRPLFTP